MKKIIFFLLLLVLFSCHRHNQFDNDTCRKKVLIDEKMFGQNSPDVFNITNGEIQGDCLIVSIRASGCSGTNWLADAVSDGSIAKSLPPQRQLRILFTNPELCEALPTRKFGFNLKNMRVSGTNSVLLNLQGWEETLVYKY